MGKRISKREREKERKEEGIERERGKERKEGGLLDSC